MPVSFPIFNSGESRPLQKGTARLLNRAPLSKWLFIFLLSIAFVGCTGRNPGEVKLVITTEFGEIEVAIDTVRAPVTSTNFLRYVDGGFYTNGRFHRTVKMDNQPGKDVLIDVIQAGANPDMRDQSFPPIVLERTNQTGLLHKDGTISMARGGPDTATSDFFICIGDQPSLDFGGKRNPDGQGFAAFGTVTMGMEVVHQIQASPAEGQKLTPQVVIVKILRGK